MIVKDIYIAFGSEITTITDNKRNKSYVSIDGCT